MVERHLAPAGIDRPVSAESGAGSLSRAPLRLLHIFAPAPVGGLESVVQMLALGQQERGAQVAVVAVLDGDTPEPPSVAALRAGGGGLFIPRSAHPGYRSEWQGPSPLRRARADHRG